MSRLLKKCIFLSVGLHVLVAALLIHAAKIDEKYTAEERKIIKQALVDINNINEVKAEALLLLAEKKDEQHKFSRSSLELNLSA